MIVDIKEAENRICPVQDRVIRRKSGMYERGTYTTQKTCDGSRCMAWRWSKRSEEHTAGFCGLAGNPEK